MQGLIDLRRAPQAVDLIAVDTASLEATLKSLGRRAESWAQAQQFRADAGAVCAVPDAAGATRAVLVGVARRDDVYAMASLPQRLPVGDYALAARGIALDPERVALGWALGSYQFTRYKTARRAPARLAVAPEVLKALAPRLGAVQQVRDLVNTPTEDLGPAELCAAVQDLAERHGGRYREWVGDALLIPGAQPRDTMQRWITRLLAAETGAAAGGETGAVGPTAG